MVCRACGATCTTEESRQGSGWVVIDNIDLVPKSLVRGGGNMFIVGDAYMAFSARALQLIEERFLVRYERKLYFFYCRGCYRRLNFINPFGPRSARARGAVLIADVPPADPPNATTA